MSIEDDIPPSKCENEECCDEDDHDHDETDSDESDSDIINITHNPLYHVLGAYLENDKGQNIANILSSIKRSIDRNTQTLKAVEVLLAKKAE